MWSRRKLRLLSTNNWTNIWASIQKNTVAKDSPIFGGVLVVGQHRQHISTSNNNWPLAEQTLQRWWMDGEWRQDGRVIVREILWWAIAAWDYKSVKVPLTVCLPSLCLHGICTSEPTFCLVLLECQSFLFYCWLYKFTLTNLGKLQ